MNIMLKKNIQIVCLVSIVFFIFTLSLFAEEEEFQPVVSFHGKINLSVDSYFGKLPDDPVDPDDPEDTDLRKIFKLTNPTTPGFTQSVDLEFYSNPLPDLEMFLKLSHTGKWGGGGTMQSLTNPLFMKEAYVRYYTDNAMYTVGSFNYELDAFAILLGNQFSSREGVTVHTMLKDTWVTLAYNRLLMSMYRDYPYTSTYLLDDLYAMRLSRRFGQQLMGFNFLFDGFYDEKGISIDLNGSVFGRSTKAELSLVYPAWMYRADKNLGEKVWPAILVSHNAIETPDHVLAVRLGVIDKGHLSQYGVRGQSEMEDAVKFNPNTYGIDLLYQRGLSFDTVLGANLVIMDFVDKQFQKANNFRITTHMAEVKLKKYFSEATDASFSISYNKEGQFHYGMLAMEWNFQY